jgi:hypothetical protein
MRVDAGSKQPILHPESGWCILARIKEDLVAVNQLFPGSKATMRGDIYLLPTDVNHRPPVKWGKSPRGGKRPGNMKTGNQKIPINIQTPQY